jgi:hypothetical protein
MRNAIIRPLKRALLPVLTLVCIGLASCIQDDVAPIVVLRNAGGDTITADTIGGTLNTILTIISDARDEQDLLDVTYTQSYPDTADAVIDYAAPIDLTNRKREVFVDISLPDSLYTAGSFGAITVRAEDMEGNVTEVRKTIIVN